MPAISPGRPVGPPRKPKKQSTTTNTHRFEPFSKRIARLRIDPVHRVQQNESMQEDSGLSTTHFGQALNHWAELNLSENFIQFVQKVKPLSESLPQILHHADSIFALLLLYIGESDAVSSEPLLSLLAHFAHDLGARFEKYFAETLKLVLSVAATHDASEVIEWSFSCLAWVLKFLSRLLVPDMRPLLIIMAPYLGKTRQKPYVIRFAAESVAFLVRKAGVIYHKNKSPLQNVVSHVFEDLHGVQNEKEKALYQMGLMSLFSETVRGVDGELHSSSVEVIRCLIDHTRQLGEVDDACLDVIEGVVISIIHETTADCFSPLAKLVKDFGHTLNNQSPAFDIAIGVRLFLIIVGTRKGSRINDWNMILDAMVHIGKIARASALASPFIMQDVMTTVAMTMQYSPLDALLPFSVKLVDLVSSGPLLTYFLPFCLLNDQIGRDRFQSLVLPHLQQFIVQEWQQNQLGLCLLVRQLTANGMHISVASQADCLISRSLIEEEIFRTLCGDEAGLDLPNIVIEAFAQFAEDVRLPKDISVAAKFVEPLRLRTLNALQREGEDEVATTFDTRRGFRTYIRLAELTGKLDNSLLMAIYNHPAPPTKSPIFLAALLHYLQAQDTTSADFSQATNLLTHLIDNLLNRTVEVKILSVGLMRHIMRQTEFQNLLSTILQVLEIPYGLYTVRQITMLIRRLTVLHKDARSDALFRRIVPYFCLGLLSCASAPIVEEVHLAIATMCEDLIDEETISDVVLKCLQSPGNSSPSHESSEDEQIQMATVTRYQCSNIQKIKDLCRKAFKLFGQPKQSLDKMLLTEVASLSNKESSMSRLQALQVFKRIPQAAEKRSRFIVPVFLSMQPAQDHISLTIDSATSTSSHTMSPEVLTGEWSLSDRKVFLELLGKFKNPKVLFKSHHVFDALLESLGARRSEIQKLALQALFTWKLPRVRRYEESLMKLTDEKTYRDELNTLFYADDESSSIQAEDRSELLPFLLRLLYGQMINRVGSKANPGGQESKRKLTLRVLFKMQHDEIAQFLDVAFGKTTIDIGENGILQNDAVSFDVINIEKQNGLVRTAESMLETLQSQLAPFGERILAPVLYCLYRACQRLDTPKQIGEVTKLETKASIARNIRRTAIHCLCMIFTCCDGIRWSLYLPSIFKYVIEPRLDNFAIETSQGVSGLLQLFAAWASDGRNVPFLNVYNKSLLYRVAACLVTPSTKDDVKIYILEQIFLRLPQLAAEKLETRELVLSVLQAHMQQLLGVLGALLESKENRKVLDSAIALLASLTPFIDSTVEVESLISAIVTLLEESSDRVGPKVKGDLLQAVLCLLKLPSSATDSCSSIQLRLRKVVSSSFNYFKDPGSRAALAEILRVQSFGDPQASDAASLCSRLNAVSLNKLDSVDYDARLEGFNAVNARAVRDSSPELWEPIVQNLIYFARAADDFAIRSNAVSSLRRFISDACDLRQPSFDALLQTTVLEALKKAAKADSEAIRADHMAMFGLLIHKCPDWTEVSDMRGLLAGNDEEASFFNNILHIQQHRRTRAMRRLTVEAERGGLRSNNICHIFLPLLEKFIFDSKDDETVRNVRGQAIVTVGDLLQWAEWSQFRAIFRRYKSYINSKVEAEKDIIKLLGVSADALVSSSLETANEGTDMHGTPLASLKTTLAKSLPSMERLSQELATHFIPDLAAFIHQKDESQVTSRIPVAITTVKILKILPEAQVAQFLPPLLLDIAYILRSRSQDSRDVARRTLAEVATILGPSCIHWILKELRTALARGYQLHILSYTTHSILVSNTDHFKSGDLDHCLDGLVAIVMDDIFGVVGQEKDAEDYISKMREVKSNKSFDSIELLAKSTTVHHLVKLIRPLQTLLTGTISSKQSRQIDELLRRIGIGLSRNPIAGSRDILMFSYEIIQELYKNLEPADKKPMTNDEINRQRFMVQLPGAKKDVSTRSSPSVYKLAKFALDVVRVTLQKHGTLLKPENVHGFLPIVGDALVQTQEDVKISAMRTLSAVIKLPMAELEDNASLYIIEAIKVVKDSINTNGEAPQAALKLIAAILRERRSIHIRDSDLSYLLHRIMPDLEEPDRQGISFNFVRAVMARKIMLPEVYDASKKIGMMMITNHGQSARDAARDIFVHFLLEFPQSEERWNKQIKFLVKNLSYQYPEGRKSTMEAINMLLNKTGETVGKELVAKLFIPVVLIMANDDNTECRRMGAALLSRCFEKADQKQLKPLLDSLRSWIQQSENPTLRKTGMQAFKVFFELPNVKGEKEVPILLSTIYQIAKEEAHSELEGTWEILHHALQLFSTVTAVFPALTKTHQQSLLWSRIRALLTYPHPWVQNSASGLIGAWFHDLAVVSGMSSLGTLPLVGSHGLQLTADAQLDVLGSSLRALKGNRSSNDLNSQIIRNLVFLGRCFNANNLTVDAAACLGIADDENSDVDDKDCESDIENDVLQREGTTPAICYLFTQLSAILRHEPRKLTSSSLLPKRSSIQALAALIHHTPTSTTLPLLSPTIIPPLAHLTDSNLATPKFPTDNNFSTTFRDLVTSAFEVLDLLQKKAGSTDYIRAMAEAQKAMREKREQRKVKRKMERLTDPEATAKEKRRRVEKEKRRRAGKRDGFRRGRQVL